MPVLHVTIPQRIKSDLQDLSESTGLPYTKLIQPILEIGIEGYKEIERLGPAEIVRLARVYKQEIESPGASSSEGVPGSEKSS